MTSIGTIEIQDLFVGSNNAVGLYLGAVKVWSKDTPQPTSPYTKVKYTAASGLPDWEGDIVGELGIASIPDGSNIAELEIGTHVTSIAGSTFFNRTNLTSVTIPDSVTSIGFQAFRSCSSLTNVTIGNGVTSIGGQAFGYCASLASVTIPDSVTSIGNGAFSGCSGLTSVTFSGKDKATVQGMTNHYWGLSSGCVIHCIDGDITV